MKKKIHKILNFFFILPFFIQIISGCTGSADAFIEKAKLSLQNGKAKEAVEYLNEAIGKDANNAAAFNMRGAAYFELKDYPNALLDYEQAIKLNPQDYKPYFNRASIKMEQSNWQGALEDCSKALELNANNAEILVKRGIIHAALQLPDAAIKDFDQALQFDPKETNALYNRGNIKFQNGELEAAIQDFTEAIKVDGQFAKAYYSLGIAQQKSGKADDACLSLKTAKRLGYADAQSALDAFCQ